MKATTMNNKMKLNMEAMEMVTGGNANEDFEKFVQEMKAKYGDKLNMLTAPLLFNQEEREKFLAIGARLRSE